MFACEEWEGRSLKPNTSGHSLYLRNKICSGWVSQKSFSNSAMSSVSSLQILLLWTCCAEQNRNSLRFYLLKWGCVCLWQYNKICPYHWQESSFVIGCIMNFTAVLLLVLLCSLHNGLQNIEAMQTVSELTTSRTRLQIHNCECTWTDTSGIHTWIVMLPGCTAMPWQNWECAEWINARLRAHGPPCCLR